MTSRSARSGADGNHAHGINKTSGIGQFLTRFMWRFHRIVRNGRKVGDGMTLKEFAQKYDVSYHIVYEASYKVPSMLTMKKDREYPEKELFAEVKNVLKTKAKRHRELALRQAEMLEHLRGRCP